MREWTDDDVKNVEDLLTSFSDADEVCAVTGCEKKDLDKLCMKAFGSTFEDTKARFRLVGRAKFNKVVFDAMSGGNAKALEMFSRMHMGYDPISTHGKAKSVPSKPDKKLEL